MNLYFSGAMSRLLPYILLTLLIAIIVSCEPAAYQVGKWDRFEGLIQNENSYADPYRDVQLEVSYKKPDGSLIRFPGFYDGGQTWRFRFMPDQLGKWEYEARFSDGSGEVLGTFECVLSDLPGPATTYSPNAYWFSSQNGAPLFLRSLHVGDRFFASNFDSLRREWFLDWAQNQGYNMLSIASHYLNRQQKNKGLGWTTPKLWPLDAAEYQKMELLLDELENRRMYVYPFSGFFGRAADWPIDPSEQEQYIRYTLSRIGPYWNLFFNIAGPEPLLKPEEFQYGNLQRADIHRIGNLIKKLDPFNHPLSVHNRKPQPNLPRFREADPFIDRKWEDYTTFQGGKSRNWWKVYSFIMQNRTILKPVYAQEVLWPGNRYHARMDSTGIRKKAIILLMAASTINFADHKGSSSSGFSGSLHMRDLKMEKHNAVKKVWDFFEKLNWHELRPLPEAVDNAYCIANPGKTYLFYMPEGDTLYAYPETGIYDQRWISGGKLDSLPDPSPFSPNATLVAPDSIQDWFLLLSSEVE